MINNTISTTNTTGSNVIWTTTTTGTTGITPVRIEEPIPYTKKPENMCENKPELFSDVEKVIYHDPATIIYFKDGSKSVVVATEDDVFDKEVGFQLAYMKHLCEKKSQLNYKSVIRDIIKNKSVDIHEQQWKAECEASSKRKNAEKKQKEEQAAKKERLAKKKQEEKEAFEREVAIRVAVEEEVWKRNHKS